MSTTRQNKHFDTESGARQFSPPCTSECPAHVDVPGYLLALAEERFTDALEIVLDRNPFPSVCGRVCLHPCEDACRRCILDEPLSIARLKRTAADFGTYPSPRREHQRSEHVAIVGGGPTGLTAAHDLAQAGFQVTVYEEKPRLGGMLRYGIPNYRLPDYALDKDIDYILSLGVEFETGVRVGKDITLDELAQRFNAVIVTAGLQASRPLPIPGADLPRIMTALPFLEEAANGVRIDLGAKVVVIGGGNVAMDVARTARRMGASDVHVVCLESEDEMPASDIEVEEAGLEDVHIHCSWGPREVTGEDCVCGLKVAKCLSVFDAEKRFSPTFDEQVIEHFDADTVIFAVGQSADVADLSLELAPRGLIQIDPLTRKTSVDGIYAAGDVVSGPTQAISAIADGHRVAASVVRDLSGETHLLEDLDREYVALAEIPESMKETLEIRQRVQMKHLDFDTAVTSFDELEFGYTGHEAAREAQRCLGCATGAQLIQEKCALCLNCIRVCPHDAPSIDGNSVYFDPELCSACGACASQCPAQAISLREHSAEELSHAIEQLLAEQGSNTMLMFGCSCTPDLPETDHDDVRLLKTTCLLRVSERNVLKALRTGAQQVAFAGCVEANCRFPQSLELVAQRAAHIKAALAQLDMDDSFISFQEADEEQP